MDKNGKIRQIKFTYNGLWQINRDIQQIILIIN